VVDGFGGRELALLLREKVGKMQGGGGILGIEWDGCSFFKFYL